jgi:[ribosomal protein S18]-alanine N-acetyltransferase
VEKIGRIRIRSSQQARKRPVYNAAVPFRIRAFESEDFDQLWQIDQECFAPGISYSRPELKAYMRRRGSFTLVAEAEQGRERADGADGTRRTAVQGFIVAYGGSVGHIITIDVIAPARRSGLGSQLLTAAEDRLRAGGSRAVGLEAAVDNLPAIAFYKRHGYNVVATWPRYYSNGVDALVMRKQL